MGMGAGGVGEWASGCGRMEGYEPAEAGCEGTLVGARVSRPASATSRQCWACSPGDDPSPNQAGLETRAPTNVPSTTCARPAGFRPSSRVRAEAVYHDVTSSF